MGRVLITTAESCSPPTPIPPRMLTKLGQSETVPDIFPTQCQAPSTWLSTFDGTLGSKFSFKSVAKNSKKMLFLQTVI